MAGYQWTIYRKVVDISYILQCDGGLPGWEMKGVHLRPPPLNQPHDQGMVDPHPSHLSKMIQPSVPYPLYLMLIQVPLPIVGVSGKASLGTQFLRGK